MSRHGPICRDMDLWLQKRMCRDRECRVATGFPGKLGELGHYRDSSITTETPLSQQRRVGPVSRQGMLCRDKVGARVATVTLLFATKA